MVRSDTRLRSCVPMPAFNQRENRMRNHVMLVALLSASAMVFALQVLAVAASGQSSAAQDGTAAGATAQVKCEQPANEKNLTTSKGDSAQASTQESIGNQIEGLQAPLKLPGVQQNNVPDSRNNPVCAPDTADANDPAASKRPGRATASALPSTRETAQVLFYVNGDISVEGRGERLSRILETIGGLAGIEMEVPDGSAQERIFDDIAAAPLRDVLRRLLDGNTLNYVIVDSADRPERIRKLIIEAKGGAAEADGAEITAAADNAGQPAEAYDAASQTPDLPVSGLQPALNPANAIPTNINIQQAAAASGKTPGQILDELQKKQIQQLDDQVIPTQPQP